MKLFSIVGMASKIPMQQKLSRFIDTERDQPSCQSKLNRNNIVVSILVGATSTLCFLTAAV